MRKVLLALMLELFATAAIAAPVAVKLPDGNLAGESSDGVATYRSIPYAAPPVGALRWKPPQPVIPWRGIRDATKDGPVCVQLKGSFNLFPPGTPQSEDCLTLNVFAPTRAKDAPVMVWLHGGAHRVGAGSQPAYDGSSFAKRGVVLVTVNYRLGALGYFAHPALTAEAGPADPLGNYGDMDQQAALRWVQRNISSFGGNPKNVTLFGESAGGQSTLYELANPPRSQGLITKAIVESGGGWTPSPSLSDEEAIGLRLAMAAGVQSTEDVAALRALSAEKVAAFNARFAPFVDGRFYTTTPAKAFADHSALKVPLVIGANDDEGALIDMMHLPANEVIRVAGPLDAARPVYGISDDKLLGRVAYGDASMVAPARFVARAAATAGSPAWLYIFSYRSVDQSRFMPNANGAVHGSEVAFVFDNIASANTPGGDAAFQDKLVAERLHGCWVAFARNGIPCKGMFDWPAYGADDRLLEFGRDAAVRTAYRKAPLDYQERRFEAQIP